MTPADRVTGRVFRQSYARQPRESHKEHAARLLRDLQTLHTQALDNYARKLPMFDVYCIGYLSEPPAPAEWAGEARP